MIEIAKKDIQELKTLANPPQLVKFTMDAVSILLDVKVDWASQRKLLSDPANFKSRLENYDIKNVDSKKLAKLKPIIECSDMTVERIAWVSKACVPLYQWVMSIHDQAISLQMN